MNGILQPQSLASAYRIDAVCDQFEAALRADEQPSLETFLCEAPTDDLAVLFWQLLMLELDYRIRSGKAPDQAMYLARFPQHVELVAAAFDDEVTWLSAAGSACGGSTPQPPRLLPGTQLEGRYTIVEFVKRGGMGELYLASDGRLQRSAAVKVLPARFAQHEGALGRFKREAETLAQLNHANIVTVFDAGQDQDVSFVVMEMLEGRDLHEELAGKVMVWQRVVEIGIAVADGLAVAHAKGIVHRDLKPRNIFITAEGITKVLDFGLAGRLEQPECDDDVVGHGSGTSTGGRFGTPGYMPPEQIMGDPVNHLSDIFSLGCVLYEMIAGGGPFVRPTVDATYAATLEESPPCLKSICKAMPADFDRIVHRCLAKDPTQRIQSAGELATALRLVKMPERLPRRWVLVAAGAFVGSLSLPLMVHSPSPHPDAVTLYNQGMELLALESESGIRQAIEKFKEAIGIDRKYAQPYSGLAMAYYELSGVYSKPNEVMPLVKSNAEEAIRLDRNLPEAYVSLGLFADRYDWDWQAAEGQFQTGLQCNSQSNFSRALVQQRYGFSLALRGDFSGARDRLNEAKKLNPTSKDIDTDLAIVEFYDWASCSPGKRDEKEFARLRSEFTRLAEDFHPAHRYLGELLIAHGDIDDGIEALEKARVTSVPNPELLGQIGHAYGLAGRGGDAMGEHAKLMALPPAQYVSKTAFALIQIGLENYEVAFDYLNEAVKDYDEYLLWLKVDPVFEPLRSDSRYTVLLEKIGGAVQP